MERIIVLSDIHANHSAFQAILDDLKLLDTKPTHFWFLGDLLGRGNSPLQVSTTLALTVNPEIWLLGNHDLAVFGNDHLFKAMGRELDRKVVLEHREQLAFLLEDIIEKFRDGPTQKEEKAESVTFWLAHGWPDSDRHQAAQIYDYAKAPMLYGHSIENQEAISKKHRELGKNVWIVGHSHRQTGWVFYAESESWQELVPGFGQALDGRNRIQNEEKSVVNGEFSFADNPDALLILNPGSVGQPRDTVNQSMILCAKYILLDVCDRSLSIEFRSVKYK